MGNTGLHYSKSLEAAPYIKKAPVYHAKNCIDSAVYLNCSQEQIVYIRKLQCNHWLLKGLPLKFKALAGNTWDAHAVNLGAAETVRSNYRILAENDRGPQVVEHEKCVCTQFDISSKCPETVQMLKNFLCKHLPEIYVALR